MASSKDIYESHMYRANIYAAGIWRGSGVTVAVAGLFLDGHAFIEPLLGGTAIVSGVVTGHALITPGLLAGKASINTER